MQTNHRLLESFKQFDQAIAIVTEDEQINYANLADETVRIMDELKSLPPHQVVAILGDYSIQSIALFIALYCQGHIVVPITATKDEEKEALIKEALCHWAIQPKDIMQKIQHANITTHAMYEKLYAKNHSGLVLFSSGSTGKPKAMVHDLDILMEHYRGKRNKSISMLLFLMFDHIGGINTLLNGLNMGATLIVPRDKNPHTIAKLIAMHKIKVLPASPTFLNLMMMEKVHENYDLSSLRMITYGTESMPESLLKQLKSIYPRVKFLQTFGTSETGISTTSSQSSDSLYMRLDDPNVEYKIVDNELWIRSKTQVLGYLNASMESFDSEGWFKTGDLVEEKDGYLKIIGRNKEVINVGGQKVLPLEVESTLLEMDEIEDALVFAMAHPITGFTVACDVVSHSGLSERELKKAIRLYCKPKLATYKIPTHVNLVEQTNFSTRFKKMRRKT